jgi:CRISPR-associated endonuclease/helicase Cas3
MFFSGDFLARKVDVESIGISYQTLNDHLEKVGDYAGDFASNIGSKSVAKLAGLLHDIGKATRDFKII